MIDTGEKYLNTEVFTVRNFFTEACYFGCGGVIKISTQIKHIERKHGKCKMAGILEHIPPNALINARTTQSSPEALAIYLK